MASRTAHVKKNLMVNILKYVAQMVTQFVLRTLLIYTLGVEYIGLDGLFTNIFAFLNLAELGIGSAIVFSMYKPIAEGDEDKVRALQDLYKKFYFYVFLVVLVVGGALTPFVEIFIKNEVTADVNIYILFVMYLFNTLVSYLTAHKKSLLFAHQRTDLENMVRLLCIIGVTIAQSIVLLIFRNFYIYVSMTIMFSIIESIATYLTANKYFPHLKGRANQPIDGETKKEISKNIMALSMHKIGGVFVNSTDNIIISSFLGVVILGAYSNYLLITSAIISIFSLFTTAFQGSVGNLIASESVDKVYEKYKQIRFIYSYLSAFATICFFVLIQPFIGVWTGGGVYLLEFSTIIILSVCVYFRAMRQSVLLFKDCAGLFWHDRWKPIVETIVNMTFSIILVQIMGINGVFIGTILSVISAPIWIEPKVLYNKYFKRSVKSYFVSYIIDALIMLSVCVIAYFVCSFIPDVGLWWVILKFAVCIVLVNILLILAYLPSKEFKSVFALLKDNIKKMFKKKAKNKK